ncbi:MAG: hypothetical protein D6729_19840 [Deltaproteobacteria bacterium]|nr:MAG: hypothetical protein D6729_19840 [Deltaproteobacteria bacterium]
MRKKAFVIGAGMLMAVLWPYAAAAYPTGAGLGASAPASAVESGGTPEGAEAAASSEAKAAADPSAPSATSGAEATGADTGARPEGAESGDEKEGGKAAGDEGEKPSKRYGGSVSHSLGFGLQIDESTRYYYGNLGISGWYRIWDQFRVKASAGLYYTPDTHPNDARNLDLAGVSIGVSHPKIFHDEALTGVKVSAGLTVGVPLSMRQVNTPSWPSVAASVGLSRKIGEVGVSYELSFTKYNPVYPVSFSFQCLEDRGLTPENPGSCIGGYQQNWQLVNRISASYSPIEKLSLSGSFSFVYGESFGPGVHSEGTVPPEVVGLKANERGSFGFNLSANYQLPVDGLSAGLSFSNGGPWRSNGQDLYNPLFDARLAALSIDVSYSF